MSVNVVTPSSHVGFDTITNQIERRLLRKGFQFNLMVVGQSGLGKSTLINTLFASHLMESSGRKDASEPIGRTSEIKVVSQEIQENGVRLKLNLIDTPGYGDQVNNEKCWDPIIKYIKDQHSQYLRKELTASRERTLPDTRVHCVLFFLQPTGDGRLKPIDVIVLRKLTESANVVPVIAKSDSLTVDEKQAFKQSIQAELAHHNLRIYPYDSPEYDQDDRALNDRIKSMIPFAVVGSESVHNVNGRQIRGRMNRWGLVDVEDETHSEFPALRKFLITTHLQDLVETTAQTHYELFRSKQLMLLKETTSAQHGHGHMSGPPPNNGYNHGSMSQGNHFNPALVAASAPSISGGSAPPRDSDFAPPVMSSAASTGTGHASPKRSTQSMLNPIPKK